MKKSIFLSALAVLAAASVSVSVYMKNETNPMGELFNANVEALESDEGGTVNIPCVLATSVCYFTVQDANGNYYTASTTGMRNAN